MDLANLDVWWCVPVILDVFLLLLLAIDWPVTPFTLSRLMLDVNVFACPEFVVDMSL
jgi:hypothetical protein